MTRSPYCFKDFIQVPFIRIVEGSNEELLDRLHLAIQSVIAGEDLSNQNLVCVLGWMPRSFVPGHQIWKMLDTIHTDQFIPSLITWGLTRPYDQQP